jgi:hypothetical protein
MPIYQGNALLGNQYVDAYQLQNVYRGANKVQGNLTVLPIPTSSLIFNVDANSTASYPGSGSTWYNTATVNASTNLLFTGSVTYVTGGFANTNYFQFNTASYYSTNNITQSAPDDRTMCAWVWADNTVQNNWMNYGGGTGFTDLATSRIVTGDNFGYWFGSNFSRTSGSITTGQWYNIIGTGREVGSGNDVLALYINGVLVDSLNNATMTTRTNRAVFSDVLLYGRLAMMSIYSVEFDASTAATYFNNTKELFGY